MDQKKEEVEEIFMALMDLYSSFQSVMRHGSEPEKIAAAKMMRHFQRLLKEKVTDYEEARGIDFSAFDALVSEHQNDNTPTIKKYKEAMLDSGEDVKRDLKKIEGDNPRKKRRSKSHMEKRLRSKE